MGIFQSPHPIHHIPSLLSRAAKWLSKMEWGPFWWYRYRFIKWFLNKPSNKVDTGPPYLSPHCSVHRYHFYRRFGRAIYRMGQQCLGHKCSRIHFYQNNEIVIGAATMLWVISVKFIFSLLETEPLIWFHFYAKTSKHCQDQLPLSAIDSCQLN